MARHRIIRTLRLVLVMNFQSTKQWHEALKFCDNVILKYCNNVILRNTKPTLRSRGYFT